jgi:site-specific DNA recombinase
MLLNEKYRGVEVWNRTKTVCNREKERTEQRPRPESEWVRVEISDLRIVSDELWQAVRETKSQGARQARPEETRRYESN